MACNCGCSPSEASHLKPVVYDPVTKQIRPLAFGEQLPEGMCQNCERQNAMAIPSKQIQDAYYSLWLRLKALEEKYCECICSNECPEPEPCPECPECEECPECPECEECEECPPAGPCEVVSYIDGIFYPGETPEGWEYSNYTDPLVITWDAWPDNDETQRIIIKLTPEGQLPPGYSLTGEVYLSVFSDSPETDVTVSFVWNSLVNGYEVRYTYAEGFSIGGIGSVTYVTLNKAGSQIPCGRLELWSMQA